MNIGKSMRREPAPLENGGGGVSGGAVLLAALAALCVVSLSLLSLARLSASEALARKAMDEAAGYYDACLAADSDIAALRAAGRETAFEAEYGISAAQDLHVAVDIHEDGSYTVLSWKAVSRGDWAPDGALGVAP